MDASIREVMEQIEATLSDGGQWCSLEKAQTLASMVFALRPRTIVELGVWLGGSLIPMALAMKALGGKSGERIVYAIDPWLPSASVVGQNEVDAQWWAGVNHEGAYKAFCMRLDQFELWPFVNVVRSTSDAAEIPPTVIDLLHVDGNHGPQVRSDAERWAPHVGIGGICIMDDIGWSGGHVLGATQGLQHMGFRMLYDLPPGVVLQRCEKP